MAREALVHRVVAIWHQFNDLFVLAVALDLSDHRALGFANAAVCWDFSDSHGVAVDIDDAQE